MRTHRALIAAGTIGSSECPRLGRGERLTWQEWMARLAAQRAPVGVAELPRHSIAMLASLRDSSPAPY
jgi:hypothetical protein